MSRTVTLLVALALSIATPAAFGTIIHVPADQPTIQAGINASSHGDTVLVQPDTYVENINFNGRNIVLGSLFLTTGDTSYTSSTVIDGDSSGSVVTFKSGEDGMAAISGFTIRNGQAGTGGGILCSNNSNPTISYNTIKGNSGFNGGGIRCHNSNPSIIYNTISANSSHIGGGIFCSNANPTISMNFITGNSADGGGGGGIECSYSDPTISNNTISGNSASYAGGIHCYMSSPMISNNTISGNSAGHIGGGITCSSSNPMISNNTISGNSARDGGGIYCYDSDPTISNNAVSWNSAGQWGGGIHCISSNPTISNNTICKNSAIWRGGGIFCDNSDPMISKNTICGNWASDGGGVNCYNSSPVLENCVIAFSTEGEALHCSFENSNPILTCCDVYGNAGGDWVGCIAGQAGINGNLSLDPLFCDTANADYHISSASPCALAHNSCGVLIGALGIGCATEPIALVDPDTMYVFQTHTIDPLAATIYFGDFTDGHAIGDVDPASLNINSTITPTSWNTLPSHPGFVGEVMEMTLPIRDFILHYGTLWNTTVQTYTVGGNFTSRCDFSIEGEVTMIGHTTGDVDADGQVTVSDLTYLVAYLFTGGDPPPIPETADVDHDGEVGVADLTALVRLLFG